MDTSSTNNEIMESYKLKETRIRQLTIMANEKHLMFFGNEDD